MLKITLQSHNYVILLPKKQNDSYRPEYNMPTNTQMARLREKVAEVDKGVSIRGCNAYGVIDIRISATSDKTIKATLKKISKKANTIL